MVPKVQNAKGNVSLSMSINGKVQNENMCYSLSMLSIKALYSDGLFKSGCFDV